MKLTTIMLLAAAGVVGYAAYNHFTAPASAKSKFTIGDAYSSAQGFVTDAATRLGFGPKATSSSSSSTSSPPASTEKVARADAGGVDITTWPDAAA